MGGFEEYYKEKRLKEQAALQEKFGLEVEEELNAAFVEDPQAKYEQQKEAGLGDNAEEPESTGSYAEEKIRERVAHSTFEERTEYYFKDTEYMKAKVERYAELGREDNEKLDEYAKKHRNRNADKRKKKARAASRSFEKARELEEKLNSAEAEGAPLTRLEKYKKRNEIMRHRMEGMINAAKVKATSDRNEEYRIAKAKLSCLSILYDQAKQLMLEKDENRKEFKKIEADLLKEIADAQKSLRKYNEDTLEKWKDSLGANNNAYLDKVIKNSVNKKTPREDAKLALMLSSLAKEAFREEYKEASSHAPEVFGQKSTARNDQAISMVRFVKRDKNGMPINREERKKEEWNKKWLAAFSDKSKAFERKKLMMEALDRAKNFNLPTPAELKKNGVYYYIKKDPVAYYEMHNMTLRLDNYAKFDPDVYLYYQNNPLIKAKLDAAKFFTSLGNEELNFHHNIDPDNMALKKVLKRMDDDDDDDDDDENDSKEFYLKTYEEAYNRIPECEKSLRKAEESYRYMSRVHGPEDVQAELNKQVRVKKLNMEAYNIFKDMQESGRFMQCPHYRAAYSRVFSENKFTNDKDISRVCGSILRPVKFDNNWKPLTEADMEAHMWNMKFLNSVVTYVAGPIIDPGTLPGDVQGIVEQKKAESKQAITEMVEKEADKFYKGFYKMPSPEQLRKELVEPIRNGEPAYSESMENLIHDSDNLFMFILKTLTFEGPYTHLPFLKEFYDANPVYVKCQEMYREFMNLLKMYAKTNYDLIPDTSPDIDMLVKGSMGIEVPEMTEMFIARYEEVYKSFNDEMQKKG